MIHVRDVFKFLVAIEKNTFLFQETAFVMCVMTVTLLGPSGYILSQLDEYRADEN